jgi:hypothetical protein
VLDDVGSTDVTACVSNLDTVVHIDPPAVTEIMFFKARSEADEPGCFGGVESQMGILFAEHVL